MKVNLKIAYYGQLTAAKRLDDFVIFFFYCQWEMKCSLHFLIDTLMNMWIYKIAREQQCIKNNKIFKMRKII